MKRKYIYTSYIEGVTTTTTTNIPITTTTTSTIPITTTTTTSDALLTAWRPIDPYCIQDVTTTTTTTESSADWWFGLSACYPNQYTYYTGPFSTYKFNSGDLVLGATGTYYIITSSYRTEPTTGRNITVTTSIYTDCSQVPPPTD